MTKILFEPAARIHSTQRYLIEFPPDGYIFVAPNSSKGIIPLNITVMNILRPPLERILPLNLATGLYQSKTNRKKGIDFVYAYNHLVFNELPWVLFAEWFHVIIGRDIRLFSYFKKFAESRLKSDKCKAIITWCDKAKKSLILNYDKTLADKIHVVPLAAPQRKFKKVFDNERIRLLFVGSPDAGYDFYHKGGLEVMMAYDSLLHYHNNLELVVRANVPVEIKQKYKDLKNLTIIEKALKWDDLHQIFCSADIFVQPTHDTPFGAFLDAMSYELPIVTRDAHLNSEIVTNGVNGFIIEGDKKINYFYNFHNLQLVPAGATPYRRNFIRDMLQVDKVFVKRLTEGLNTLIEDEKLRRAIGNTNRKEVESGRFSIARRNAILKSLFDKSVGI